MCTDLTWSLLFLHTGFNWQPATSPLWLDRTRGQAVLDRLAVKEHPECWQAHRPGPTNTGWKPGESHGHSHVPPTTWDGSVCIHLLDHIWNSHVGCSKQVVGQQVIVYCLFPCCNILDLKWMNQWLWSLSSDVQLQFADVCMHQNIVGTLAIFSR